MWKAFAQRCNGPIASAAVIPGSGMPTEYIGDYLVEYSGEPLCLGKGWAAYLAIYDVSRNPAFRASILPKHRVSLDSVFLTQEAAAERAREIAIVKIGPSAGVKRS